MTSLFFGLAHYSGTFPSGLFWVFLTGFLGYLFGKSMLETKGMEMSWFLHFISDVPGSSSRLFIRFNNRVLSITPPFKSSPSRLSPYACTLTTGLATAARPSASRTNSWPNSRTQISSGAWPKEKKKTIVFFSCPALRPGQGARLVFSGPTGGRPPPGSRFPFPSRSPG